jgi:hypothetical protein
MVHPLDGPRFKIERASEHLDTLDRERTAFLADVDNRIVGRFEPETSNYIFNVSGDPPDLRWAPIVGEIAHNLRSALDNLTSALVTHRGNVVTNQTQFVIADTVLIWDAELKRKRLRGLSTDDIALIQELQPYHRANFALAHPLSRLGWLSNRDKHPDIHVAYVIIDNLLPLPPRISMPISANDTTGPMAMVMLNSGSSSGDRTEIARCLLPEPGPNPQMHMQLNNPIDISFSDSARGLTLNDLTHIRDEVARIYGIFEPLLRS